MSACGLASTPLRKTFDRFARGPRRVFAAVGLRVEFPELAEDDGHLGVLVGTGRKLAMDVDRLLHRLRRLLPSFESLQRAAQVAEAGRQGAPVIVRRRRVEKASIDLDGFFERFDTLFGLSRPTEVVEAHGQVGQAGRRTHGGQSAIEFDDLDVDVDEIAAR